LEKGSGSTLAHALRVLADGTGKRGIESYRKQRLFRRKARASAVKASEVAQVFHGGELVIEHRGMAHVADARPLLGNLFRFAGGEDAGGSQGWFQKPGEHPQKGRFAGSIFSQQNVTTAGSEADRNFAQRREAAEEARYLVELR
jgi:hypothetical protein